MGNLTYADGDLIWSATGWMNSSIVSETQTLLKKMAPQLGGFQETCLGVSCGYTIETNDLVQVLHNGSDHWLTISTIGARQDELFIFDSLYCSVSQSVKNQIAAILATTSKRIQLNFVSVQKKSGGCDCGLFTLAFATTLVSGHNPGALCIRPKKDAKTSVYSVKCSYYSNFQNILGYVLTSSATAQIFVDVA